MVAVPKILGTYTAQHNKHIPAFESQRNTIYCKHGTSLCEHGYGKKESLKKPFARTNTKIDITTLDTRVHDSTKPQKAEAESSPFKNIPRPRACRRNRTR